MDNKQGRCINFRECNWMLQLIQQYTQNRDQFTYQTIWASVCNYANGDPDVCCPLEFSQSANGFFIFSSVNNNLIQDSTTTVSNTKTINFGNDPATQNNRFNTIEDNRCGITNATQTRVIGGKYYIFSH